MIVLDPVNLGVIRSAMQRGVRNYIGGNCTVSCMLMGVGALFKADLVEWMTCTTYQAASGGGAQHMRELLAQYGAIHATVRSLLDDPKSAILDIDREVVDCQRSLSPEQTANFGVPLGGNLIPWIDADRGDGTSLEEWKGGAETNKILGFGSTGGAPAVPIDSTCVRIGAMRCHSQSLALKLKRDVPLADIEAMIAADNDWVSVVPNSREASVRQLTPVAVSGTLGIPVGRLRSSPWASAIWALSRSAISSSGAPPSRCAAPCGCCWSSSGRNANSWLRLPAEARNPLPAHNNAVKKTRKLDLHERQPMHELDCLSG